MARSQVSWYEALAFTRWLTEHLHREERLPEGLEARLPSEAEWEKAARGGVEVPAEPFVCAVGKLGTGEDSPGLVANREPRRPYTWGSEPDPERANYTATNVGTTSAVGCFPLGASPYGCLDVAGNVWEWTRSLWNAAGDEGIPSDGVLLVLRGGGFSSVGPGLRCACRDGGYPDVSYGGIGFRVAVSPSTSGL